MVIEELRQLLTPLDKSLTECDGMTRLCHTLLLQHDIPHQVYCGSCQVETQLIPLHFWIDLKGVLRGWRVDYRLRMWIGDKKLDVPHGVFNFAAFSQVHYQGETIEMSPLSESLFQVLMLAPNSPS
ncbi:conserved hypothetical protein (plasmid) [Acaryochloris marina MBIC11017]|uniref:Uncharacterized protein n=1 Tax=Acaryochloris marina (strain MBIC 11017) TaxID=329726 RepID=A8ZLK1_ACAM1|nr:hypothetical protein [Acaryochloris marina]ABW32028.1 conserved hypothetical protein [Acaryochloris marina MBIC11017]